MQTSDPSYFFRAENDVAKEEARNIKAERIKDLGAPVSVSGKILDIEVKGSDVWIAESDHIARRLSLETGKTLQIYKGHTGPVTCLALINSDYLITGSWDKTLKIWKTSDKSLIFSINAHDDFVKTLLVVPSLSLIISSSSDRTVRIWDTTDFKQPFHQVGSIAAHTRPVEALAFQKQTDLSGVLYTADSLGAIKAWDIQRLDQNLHECQVTLKNEWIPHRTGINALFVANDLLFTGSSDESVAIQNVPKPLPDSKVLHHVTQPHSVKALLPLFLTFEDATYLVVAVGDSLRIYSYDPLSAQDPPELLCEIEAHSHDITSLDVWMRTGKNGKAELWILSASLDSTLRRWSLSDVLTPKSTLEIPDVQRKAATSATKLTEEEERELAELMEDD